MTAPYFCLKNNLCELQEVVEIILNLKTLNGNIKENLVWLFEKLCFIREGVPSLFTFDLKKDLLLGHLKLLQKNIDAYFTLIKTIDDIKIALSHLLDLLEKNDILSQYGWKLETFIDLVDDCSNVATQLTQWLQSRKDVVDATLEYNEISVDHIDTLGNIVSSNIQTCFELQEVRFSSPVRHTPSFTLKELIRVLSSYTESSELKVPTFSSLEDSLCRRFLRLKHSILPIEKSLVELLPQRIEHFGRRNIKNIEHLCFLMTDRCGKLSSEFQFMVEEINQLKIELIDKKWSILFQNLIHELAFIFEELESLQKKMSEKDYEKDIQEKFVHQLKKKTRTINKTFNAIEKATELSLLDSSTVSKYEELSRKWNEIKPISERLQYEKVSDDKENNVDDVAQKLKSLRVSSDIQAAEIPRNKFGALLMKKMNIKPVMIAGSPASVEKINPFYESSPESTQDRGTERLVMHAVPPLPYKNYDDSFEHDVKPIQQPLEVLENEKKRFYSRKRTQIPTFKVSTVLPANFLLTPPSKVEQQWTPYRGRGRSLRPPTPVSVLLTSRVV